MPLPVAAAAAAPQIGQALLAVLGTIAARGASQKFVKMRGGNIPGPTMEAPDIVKNATEQMNYPSAAPFLPQTTMQVPEILKQLFPPQTQPPDINLDEGFDLSDPPFDQNLLSDLEDAPFEPEGEETEETLFHGTKASIGKLSEADPIQFGKVSAIYGEGLYLTDNPEVAESYSKRKGSGPQGNVLSGKVSKDVNLLDLDKEIPEELRPVFMDIIKNYTDEQPSSWKGVDVYDHLRDVMADNEIMESEAIENFQELNNVLWTQGFQGLKHIGGRKIKSPFGEHNVKILFQNPFTLKIDAIKDAKENY